MGNEPIEIVRWLSLKGSKEGAQGFRSLIYLDRRPVYAEEKDALGEEYFRGKTRYSMAQCLNMRGKGSIFGVSFVFDCVVSLKMSYFFFLVKLYVVNTVSIKLQEINIKTILRK